MWWNPIRSPRADDLCIMGRIKGILLLLAFGLLVFFITREAYKPEATTEQVDATVLLERVRPVLKLVTVEGDFSEVITFSDANAAWFDWTRDLPWNRKQAMLLVKARASVGYDLEGMGLEFDDATRTVRFTGMGKPKLLSLEHDVKYYDLEEGTFNAFSADDHTRMNAQAKQRIQAKIPASGLFRKAEEQQGEFLVILKAVVENAGWTFVEGNGKNGPAAPLKD
jgi:hypothetical protein